MAASSNGKWLLRVAGAMAGSYTAYVVTTWFRYGKTSSAGTHYHDVEPLADRYLPEYDVVERHQVRVKAPAAITYQAACSMDLKRSRLVRALFRGREWILGAERSAPDVPRGIVEEMKAVGWGVLEEIPSREIVLGAVTQPWIADVVFRSLPPSEFTVFREPGFVKIVVTFRAEPAGAAASIFKTETRVATTDPTARSRFRWYWSFLSPGILLIRWVSLGMVRTEAERKALVVDTPPAPAAARGGSLFL
jgi:hypothetical protein